MLLLSIWINQNLALIRILEKGYQRLMGFREDFEELEKLLADSEKKSKKYFVQILYSGSALLVLLLLAIFIFRPYPTFLILTFFLLIPFGNAVNHWFCEMKNQVSFKKRLDPLTRHSAGKIHESILRITQDINRFQQKLSDYERSLRKGREYLGYIKDTLNSKDLYPNRKKRYELLKENLEKNISYKQLILEFYQEAKNRFEKEKYNLEQDLKSLEVLDYLKYDRNNDYLEQRDLVSTQLKMDFLEELEQLEARLPLAEAEAKEMTHDTAIQLKLMIRQLKSVKHLPETFSTSYLSEFQDDTRSTEKGDITRSDWEHLPGQTTDEEAL